MSPAIVICAYNRPELLFRLIKSIEKAKYVKGAKLIISVDHSDRQEEVVGLLKEYSWIYGDYEIITHSENIGLREHVLFCGDLSEKYGAIILLEEDLLVSPMFYKFSIDAVNFYDKCEKISGISLYNQSFCETSQLGFEKINQTGSDVYFLQVASSWGQVWTKQQWSKFRAWYGNNQLWSEKPWIPHNLNRWPESSWKKYFIRFNIENDLYFVYPRSSLTTNFCDSGTHHKKKKPRFQVPLEQNVSKSWSFLSLVEECAVYDAYCELSAESLVKLCDLSVDPLDLEVDIYAQKSLSDINKKYLVTTRKSLMPISQFALDIKPRELNIQYGLGGEEIVLAETCSFTEQRTLTKSQEQEYYFGIPVY
jgi:glycosyltransferase involved in cell wall biosynthesis